MTFIRKSITLALLALGLATQAQAAQEVYKFDMKGAHAFIQFKIPHLGYSMLLGEFTEFDGEFSLDPDAPENASVKVDISPASIHSNHGERDKHLRGSDFLNVTKYPKASFVSTKVDVTGDDTANVHGDLTLLGVTKSIVLDMKHIGAGDDPWGGYRRGFEGTTSFTLADFGIDYNLGPASKAVEIYVSIEGIRQGGAE